VPGVASARTPATSTLTVVPSATTVDVLQPLSVSGTVAPAAARPVTMQRLYGKTWRSVTTGSTGAGGRYTLTVPTNQFVGAATYRVQAPATAAYAAASSRTSMTIDGKGDASSMSLLMGGDTVRRWNPCAAITYRVNTRHAPASAVSDVRAALGRLTAQSGLRYRYLGHTAVVPSRTTKNPKGTDLVVAWVRPGSSSYLPSKGPAGVGGAWVPSGTNVATLFNGFVLLDSTLYPKLAKGFGAGPAVGYQGTREQLLMHEIGHAMGMGHTTDSTQIMYTAMERRPAVWGNGDAANLTRLGLPAGCISTQPATGARVMARATVRALD
jgi:5-hydroxyisourate hydrolase-like protein (transthyretin family)